MPSAFVYPMVLRGWVLTIRPRDAPGDSFWWAWISGDDRPLRRVRSLEQVPWVMAEFECNHVDWPGSPMRDGRRRGRTGRPAAMAHLNAIRRGHPL